MIGCLQTHVEKQPFIALYFEFETVLKFYNLEAWLKLCENVIYTGKGPTEKFLLVTMRDEYGLQN